MPISGSKASDASKTTTANNTVGKVGRPSVRNWEKKKQYFQMLDEES